MIAQCGLDTFTMMLPLGVARLGLCRWGRGSPGLYRDWTVQYRIGLRGRSLGGVGPLPCPVTPFCGFNVHARTYSLRSRTGQHRAAQDGPLLLQPQGGTQVGRGPSMTQSRVGEGQRVQEIVSITFVPSVLSFQLLLSWATINRDNHHFMSCTRLLEIQSYQFYLLP